MKAILTKNLQVKSLTTYLVIEKEKERKDIQEFLNGKEFEDEVVNERVKEYLIKISVLDENNIPTQKGERIKKTGKMFVREEGVYKIWYVDNDTFLREKLLYIQRIAPKNNENLTPLNMSFQQKGHHCLPTEHNEFYTFNLIENQEKDKLCEIDKNQYSIHLTWKWDNLDTSYLIFDGSFNNFDSQKNKNPKNEIKIKRSEIPFQDDLKKRIQEILPEWSSEYNRLKIRFDELLAEEKKDFEKTFSQQQYWNDFDVKIQNLPLMPYDKKKQ